MNSPPRDENDIRSILVDALRLTLFGCLCWVLLAGPAWLVAKQTALIGLTVSAVLCLFPGYLAVAVQSTSSRMNSVVVLASGVFRMVFVLTGCLIINVEWPQMGLREFHVWLILFYLSTLAFETFLVVPKQQSSG